MNDVGAPPNVSYCAQAGFSRLNAVHPRSEKEIHYTKNVTKANPKDILN
jgi:hypothetical protein